MAKVISQTKDVVMKKQFRQLGAAIALLFVFTGCASVRELAPEQRKGEPATLEYKLAREVIVAFMNNDAKKFRKNFSPENAQKFDVNKFDEARREVVQSLGTPVSFSYLTELEFVSFKLYVWKVRFKRLGKDRETKEEKEFYSEALFRVITGRSGRDKVMIMGFNFL